MSYLRNCIVVDKYVTTPTLLIPYSYRTSTSIEPPLSESLSLVAKYQSLVPLEPGSVKQNPRRLRIDQVGVFPQKIAPKCGVPVHEWYNAYIRQVVRPRCSAQLLMGLLNGFYMKSGRLRGRLIKGAVGCSWLNSWIPFLLVQEEP